METTHDSIHEHPMTALDYTLQAKVGLRLCGLDGLAQDLDPIVENLYMVVTECLRLQNCGAVQGNSDREGDSRERRHALETQERWLDLEAEMQDREHCRSSRRSTRMG